MKVVVRTLSVVLAVSVTIAAIAAGALYVDGRTVYQGPDLLAGSVRRAPAIGPLRVPPSDARYFVDTAGRPVYLTGSHTWNNLQDLGYTDPPDQFDFEEYLRFLELRNHNFIRMWRSESPRVSVPGRVMYVAPHPWLRTGPGAAADGKARFDLTKFDPAYFDRLRTRVRSAGERGFYVSVMLFEGWGMRFSIDGYNAHPFKATNNVNGIECDLNRDGKGLECFTLTDAAVTRLQEAYVRQVVDTVNDLDNVLYEISNENHWDSFEFEEHFMNYVRQYESGKPKQHPVGLTSNGGGSPPHDDTGRLFASSADWISPNALGSDYKEKPPVAKGRAVIISDTDHLWGLGGSTSWVWKSFTRGLNPIFMDLYHERVVADETNSQPQQWELVRRAMGHTAWFAQRIDLNAMVPRPELVSTGYALVNPGVEYLVFLPYESHPLESSRLFGLFERPIRTLRAGLTREAVVDLSRVPGEYTVEWFNPSSGEMSQAEPVTGGVTRALSAPFGGDAVLHLKRKP